MFRQQAEIPTKIWVFQRVEMVEMIPLFLIRIRS